MTTEPTLEGQALCDDARPRRSTWAGGLHLSERRIVLLIGDTAALSLALLLTLLFRFPALGISRPCDALALRWWVVLVVLWAPLATTLWAYDLRRAAQALRSATHGAALAGIFSLLYLLVPIYSAPLTRSRLSWFLFCLLAMLGVASWRVLYAKLVSQPTFSRRLLIMGAGQSGRALATALSGLAAGPELLGFVDDDPSLAGQVFAGRPVLATTAELLSLAELHRIDEIAVAIGNPEHISERQLDTLVRCWARGIRVLPLPLYYEEVIEAVPVQHIQNNWYSLVNRQGLTLRRIWQILRRLVDIGVGACGLLLLLPLSPLIALTIYLDCPGPILYRQQRVGLCGRLFWIHKFRSMIPNAERHGAVWAKDSDDRITRVGRIMRKTRIDELPQLWNLLDGSMTLIGPRPERPEFVRQLERQIPYYAIRHSIPPGLTGWAQVRYHYGNSVEDALAKLQYDLYYVKHGGPTLDALILLHTVRVLLQFQGT
jgi:exopolysaccharide biosynthesis polyprenyl glycosylphosphotransferase